MKKLVCILMFVSSYSWAGGGGHNHECGGCGTWEWAKTQPCPTDIQFSATVNNRTFAVTAEVESAKGTTRGSFFSCVYSVKNVETDASSLSVVDKPELHVGSVSGVRVRMILEGQKIDSFIFQSYNSTVEGIYKIVPQFQKVYPEIELQEFSGSMLSISPSTLEVPQLVNGYDHSSYLRL